MIYFNIVDLESPTNPKADANTEWIMRDTQQFLQRPLKASVMKVPTYFTAQRKRKKLKFLYKRTSKKQLSTKDELLTGKKERLVKAEVNAGKNENYIVYGAHRNDIQKCCEEEITNPCRSASNCIDKPQKNHEIASASSDMSSNAHAVGNGKNIKKHHKYENGHNAPYVHGHKTHLETFHTMQGLNIDSSDAHSIEYNLLEDTANMHIDNSKVKRKELYTKAEVLHHHYDLSTPNSENNSPVGNKKISSDMNELISESSEYHDKNDESSTINGHGSTDTEEQSPFANKFHQKYMHHETSTANEDILRATEEHIPPTNEVHHKDILEAAALANIHTEVQKPSPHAFHYEITQDKPTTEERTFRDAENTNPPSKEFHYKNKYLEPPAGNVHAASYTGEHKPLMNQFHHNHTLDDVPEGNEQSRSSGEEERSSTDEFHYGNAHDEPLVADTYTPSLIDQQKLGIGTLHDRNTNHKLSTRNENISRTTEQQVPPTNEMQNEFAQDASTTTDRINQSKNTESQEPATDDFHSEEIQDEQPAEDGHTFINAKETKPVNHELSTVDEKVSSIIEEQNKPSNKFHHNNTYLEPTVANVHASSYTGEHKPLSNYFHYNDSHDDVPEGNEQSRSSTEEQKSSTEQLHYGNAHDEPLVEEKYTPNLTEKKKLVFTTLHDRNTNHKLSTRNENISRTTEKQVPTTNELQNEFAQDASTTTEGINQSKHTGSQDPSTDEFHSEIIQDEHPAEDGHTFINAKETKPENHELSIVDGKVSSIIEEQNKPSIKFHHNNTYLEPTVVNVHASSYTGEHEPLSDDFHHNDSHDDVQEESEQSRSSTEEQKSSNDELHYGNAHDEPLVEDKHTPSLIDQQKLGFSTLHDRNTNHKLSTNENISRTTEKQVPPTQNEFALDASTTTDRINQSKHTESQEPSTDDFHSEEIQDEEPAENGHTFINAKETKPENHELSTVDEKVSRIIEEKNKPSNKFHHSNTYLEPIAANVHTPSYTGEHKPLMNVFHLNDTNDDAPEGNEQSRNSTEEQKSSTDEFHYDNAHGGASVSAKYTPGSIEQQQVGINTRHDRNANHKLSTNNENIPRTTEKQVPPTNEMQNDVIYHASTTVARKTPSKNKETQKLSTDNFHELSAVNEKVSSIIEDRNKPSNEFHHNNKYLDPQEANEQSHSFTDELKPSNDEFHYGNANDDSSVAEEHKQITADEQKLPMNKLHERNTNQVLSADNDHISRTTEEQIPPVMGDHDTHTSVVTSSSIPSRNTKLQNRTTDDFHFEGKQNEPSSEKEHISSNAEEKRPENHELSDGNELITGIIERKYTPAEKDFHREQDHEPKSVMKHVSSTTWEQKPLMNVFHQNNTHYDSSENQQTPTEEQKPSTDDTHDNPLVANKYTPNIIDDQKLTINRLHDRNTNYKSSGNEPTLSTTKENRSPTNEYRYEGRYHEVASPNEPSAKEEENSVTEGFHHNATDDELSVEHKDKPNTKEEQNLLTNKLHDINRYQIDIKPKENENKLIDKNQSTNENYHKNSHYNSSEENAETPSDDSHDDQSTTNDQMSSTTEGEQVPTNKLDDRNTYNELSGDNQQTISTTKEHRPLTNAREQHNPTTGDTQDKVSIANDHPSTKEQQVTTSNLHGRNTNHDILIKSKNISNPTNKQMLQMNAGEYISNTTEEPKLSSNSIQYKDPLHKPSSTNQQLSSSNAKQNILALRFQHKDTHHEPSELNGLISSEKWEQKTPTDESHYKNTHHELSTAKNMSIHIEKQNTTKPKQFLSKDDAKTIPPDSSNIPVLVTEGHEVRRQHCNHCNNLNPKVTSLANDNGESLSPSHWNSGIDYGNGDYIQPESGSYPSDDHIKSGYHGMGPERGGPTVNKPEQHVNCLRHDEPPILRMGPPKFVADPPIYRENTGYPLYHIPPKTGEASIPDFYKPCPPVHGCNPYEILTSSQLNGTVYTTDYPCGTPPTHQPIKDTMQIIQRPPDGFSPPIHPPHPEDYVVTLKNINTKVIMISKPQKAQRKSKRAYNEGMKHNENIPKFKDKLMKERFKSYKYITEKIRKKKQETSYKTIISQVARIRRSFLGEETDRFGRIGDTLGHLLSNSGSHGIGKQTIITRSPVQILETTNTSRTIERNWKKGEGEPTLPQIGTTGVSTDAVSAEDEKYKNVTSVLSPGEGRSQNATGALLPQEDSTVKFTAAQTPHEERTADVVDSLPPQVDGTVQATAEQPPHEERAVKLVGSSPPQKEETAQVTDAQPPHEEAKLNVEGSLPPQKEETAQVTDAQPPHEEAKLNVEGSLPPQKEETAQVTDAQPPHEEAKLNVEGSLPPQKEETAHITAAQPTHQGRIVKIAGSLPPRKEEPVQVTGALPSQGEKIEKYKNALLSAHEEKNERLSNALSTQEQYNGKLTNALSTQETNNGRLANALSEHENKNEKLTNAVAAHEENNRKLMTAMSAHEDENKRLETSVSANEEENKRLACELSAQTERNEKLMSALHSAKLENNARLENAQNSDENNGRLTGTLHSQPRLNNFVIITGTNTQPQRVNVNTKDPPQNLPVQKINGHIISSSQHPPLQRIQGDINSASQHLPLASNTYDDENVIRPIESGYPVFNIPHSNNDVIIPEYHKPLPPLYGINPYEVITSSELNGSSYKTEHYDPERVRPDIRTDIIPIQKDQISLTDGKYIKTGSDTHKQKRRYFKELKNHKKSCNLKRLLHNYNKRTKRSRRNEITSRKRERRKATKLRLRGSNSIH